ncbi:RT0821/Lpp0805 family surface protein [Skermanella pratensis]|uniref:RT0821/Lpp0805 family surface protein n=1 Tax=Skermanella pratensis TaxID=2233999 RepID=UPI0017886C35|nr:RT0821/Lpp0805 family surface protein [Skermanella pratensis]
MKKFLLAAAVLALAGCADKPAGPGAVSVIPEAAPLVTLEDSDRTIIDQTLQTASRGGVGKPVQWSNPATGKNGAVTVIRQGYTRDGKLCQEFHLVAAKGVVRAQQVGKACRESGKWSPEGGYTLGS